MSVYLAIVHVVLLFSKAGACAVKGVLVRDDADREEAYALVALEIVAHEVGIKGRNWNQRHNEEEEAKRFDHSEVELETNAELANLLDISGANGKASLVILATLCIFLVLASYLEICDFKVDSLGEVSSDFVIFVWII